MTQHIREEHVDSRTLEEVISKHYADYNIIGGSAPMDMDVTHGMEIRTADNRDFGHGISVNIYPYVKWSDGVYKPCHYWGTEYYIMLEKR